MSEDENLSQEELDSMIASSMAKYFKAEADKKQKADEAQKAMDDKFTATIDEAKKIWEAEKEKEYNEQLTALSKQHNFSLDDTGDKEKPPEIFNAAQEFKDDGFVSIKESKEWASHYCSKTMKDKGMDVKTNSFVSRPYEEMMTAYQKYGIESFIAVDSDADCDDDVHAWECEDCFVDSIMYAVICKSDILGKVGHRVFAHDKGCGGQIQVKTINIPSPSTDWGYPATLSPCECLTCVTNAFSTYTIQIKKYGDYRVICNADEILAGDLQGPVMQTMAIRLAERIDHEIVTNLLAAANVYGVNLGVSCGSATRTTNCCEWTIDLWDAIMELEGDMRAGGYFGNSDPVLLINPDVAVYLKYRNGLSIPPWMIGSIQMDGTTITKIGNIKVIETCHMNACSTDGGATDGGAMALLIDPDRAFAEVWAQKPKFRTDYDPIECDSTKLVVFAYGAFDVLDPGAIGVISNP